MIFRCPNCGCEDYVETSQFYKCKVCRKEFRKEVIAEKQKKEDIEIKEAKSFNDNLILSRTMAKYDFNSSFEDIKREIASLKTSMMNEFNERIKNEKEEAIEYLENVISEKLISCVPIVNNDSDNLKEYIKNTIDSFKEAIKKENEEQNKDLLQKLLNVFKDIDSTYKGDITIPELIDRASKIEDYTAISVLFRNIFERFCLTELKKRLDKDKFIYDSDFFFESNFISNFYDTYTYNGVLKFKTLKENDRKKIKIIDRKTYWNAFPTVRFVLSGEDYDVSVKLNSIWTNTNYFVHYKDSGEGTDVKAKELYDSKTKKIKNRFKEYYEYIKGSGIKSNLIV